MMRLSTLLLPAAIALLLFTCTQGTGSEVEGRCAIEGRAVDKQGYPVAGAKVRIRPVGFIAFYADDFMASDTLTDNNGFFRFDTVPADSYTIEINNDGKTGALVELNVASHDSFPIVLPADTLTPTGEIYGRINLPISDDTARPWVALYNVDYLAAMPLTQDFRFNGVPEGVYHLRIVPYRESNLIVELHDIRVVSEGTVDVGTLNFFIMQFFKGCTSRECDSLAVRSILDANELTAVPVESVVTVDTVTGRVTGLNLSRRSIVTITKEIGSLSQLVSLDLSGNRIQSLPGQIGYLPALRECRLDSNDLYELPAEFAYCCSLKVLTARGNNLYRIDARLAQMPLVHLDLRGNILAKLPDVKNLFPVIRYLYLDYNLLQSLPDALQQLHPVEFSIGNNRLCTLTQTVRWWLGSYDEDWPASQDCPETVSSQ